MEEESELYSFFHLAPKVGGEHLPDWSLTEMIDVAYSLEWINYDVKQFSHALRNFRNLIHPKLQLELQTFPDADTVKICLPVFNACVNDLSKLFLENQGILNINISSCGAQAVQ